MYMDPINYAFTRLLDSEPELQVPSGQTSANTLQDISSRKAQVVQRFHPYCLNKSLLQGSLDSRSKLNTKTKHEPLKRRKAQERRNVLLRRCSSQYVRVSDRKIETQIQQHSLSLTNCSQEELEEAYCVPICENNTMNCVDEDSGGERIKYSVEDRPIGEQSSKIPTICKITNKISSTSPAILPVCETSFMNISLLPRHSNSRRICSVLNLSCDRVSSACLIAGTSIRTNSAQLLSSPVYPVLLTSEDPNILLCTTHSSTVLMPSARLPSLAWHAANRIIRHARNNKTPNMQFLLCQDCNKIPILPVTGKCGHTRCSKCIEDNGACTCGSPPPKKLFVNTVIKDIIENMTSRTSNKSPCQRLNQDLYGEVNSRTLVSSPLVRGGSLDRHQPTRPESYAAGDGSNSLIMNPQSRLKLGRELLSARHYKKAAVHLARAATAAPASPALRRQARSLLVRAVSELCSSGEVRRVTREVCRLVGAGGGGWVRRGELECALCYHTYTRPVTTPCGHTYCRTCLERSLDYRKACALCLRPLHDFHLASTGETVFICAALASIDALNPPLPMGPDVIPIFVCTVAFPAIPCPLLIFDPRYWLMIRRVLESGSRQFGMVAYERGNTYSDYGTVLEVCDCVHFEDGRSILSTVGVSRFKIIERDIRDGCDVARIEPLIDELPTEERLIWDMRIVATQISYKALLWFNSMNRSIRSEIEAAFGCLPHIDCAVDDWWESPDGPAWLWWLIAILPLRSELKMLVLSTKSLLKRMLTVSRTLDVIDHVALSASLSSECELRNSLTGAEDWLETNS